MYSERRPPPLPIPAQPHQSHQQQHQHPHQHPHQGLHQGLHISCASPAGSTPGAGVPRSMSNAASPADVHRRAQLSATLRGGTLFQGKADSDAASSQPTPVSPMSVGAAQHMSESLSPAPPQPHSANPGQVQVNIYPPPEPTMWRWPHAHHAQPPTLPPTPNSCGYQHGYPPPGQRPALALARGVHSPHAHIVHGAMHEPYHSPGGAVMASLRTAGHPPPGRAEREKKTCKSCGTDSSPEWRKGPTGHKT
ncbi:hypothetical protein IWQ56_003929 [Coemansia nantahalensis]|nr:hypothetical protein IWQ56_003929 [Coemansia nantahalensis]